MAAAVAAATCGFDGLLHIPKGIIFFIGILSMIVAAGLFSTITLFSGVIIKLEGATPNEH